MRLGADLRVSLVDNYIFGDVPFVGFLINDPRSVGRPPEAGRPAEFFLGDELGQAVRQAVGRPFGEADFVSGIEVDDVQVPLSDEGDAVAIRAELGVDLGGFGLSEAGRGPVTFEEVEVAGQGEDASVALRGADDLADARVSHPHPFASERFFPGNVLIRVPFAGRPGDDFGNGSLGHLTLPEDPCVPFAFGKQEGNGGTIRREGDGGRDGRPRRRVIRGDLKVDDPGRALGHRKRGGEEERGHGDRGEQGEHGWFSEAREGEWQNAESG